MSVSKLYSVISMSAARRWCMLYFFVLAFETSELTLRRPRLRCDGTRAETRFRLSVKRTSPFKSAGGVGSVDYSQPRCAASAVVMLDTPCSEVVWRVLVTHSIHQFPVHFPSRASPCAITFQLDSTDCLEILGDFTACSPKALSRPVHGFFYL